MPGTSSNQEDFSTLQMKYAGIWYNLESYPSWVNNTPYGAWGPRTVDSFATYDTRG